MDGCDIRSHQLETLLETMVGMCGGIMRDQEFLVVAKWSSSIHSRTCGKVPGRSISLKATQVPCSWEGSLQMTSRTKSHSHPTNEDGT